MSSQLDFYEEIWVVDTEFIAPPGERPQPVCLVARELRSQRLVQLWRDGLLVRSSPPYPVGPSSLVVAYYASAELGVHLALGWALPCRVLDLYAEFRCLTAGLAPPHGNGLLGALSWYGLDAMDSGDKVRMRELIQRGGPWSAEEQRAILAYCQEDVDALARLLPRMLPSIDLPRALLRGRYMIAAARMEAIGTPIDVPNLAHLRHEWDRIRRGLITSIDTDYGLYRGTTFKVELFEGYLKRQGLAWPHLENGQLALDDDTFREMARAHPADVGPLRELRHTLGQLRLNDLAVGPDGRNRVLLSAFSSKTSRNQPSNSAFIFGPSCWLRSLIKPEPGMAVAYCDWSQQELAIAAALSGDLKMQDAYTSGDFYLTFAKMAGAAPHDATKTSHRAIREQFKVVSLGVLYGLGANGLARKLGVAPVRGRELLDMHRQAFPRFWAWSDAIEMEAMLTNQLQTVFGWTIRVGQKVNPRSLRNFPMQANGAEMLRLACCLATEKGVQVCCPVHDALLVEGTSETIENVVARTRAYMQEASQVVLNGFSLRTDAKVVTYPDRYVDERGEKMWGRVMSLLGGG
jgi:DNA polymerase I